MIQGHWLIHQYPLTVSFEKRVKWISFVVMFFSRPLIFLQSSRDPKPRQSWTRGLSLKVDIVEA